MNARQDVLIRGPTAPNIGNLRDGYELSNSGYGQTNTTNTVRGKLTTNWDGGNFSNELLGGMNFIRDSRELANVFQGKAQGYAYGRQGNPTAAALEEKINRMEDGIATVCCRVVTEMRRPCAR